MERVTTAGPGTEGLRALFLEHAGDPGFSPCFQWLDEELERLPQGCAALMLQPAQGCLGVRPLDGETAEMERLYLRPAARGCERMVLDTLPGRMEAAIRLCRALGFRDCAPYCDEPLSGALCLELRLR